MAEARRWVANCARSGGATDDAVSSSLLVTSEVVTNAIVHASATTSVIIRARLDGTDLTVTVLDEDTRPPVPRQGRAGLPGGQGMHIVEALSSRWGWHRQPKGKAVWFTISW